jgi:hypothetical protein
VVLLLEIVHLGVQYGAPYIRAYADPYVRFWHPV